MRTHIRVLLILLSILKLTYSMLIPNIRREGEEKRKKRERSKRGREGAGERRAPRCFRQILRKTVVAWAWPTRRAGNAALPLHECTSKRWPCMGLRTTCRPEYHVHIVEVNFSYLVANRDRMLLQTSGSSCRPLSRIQPLVCFRSHLDV